MTRKDIWQTQWLGEDKQIWRRQANFWSIKISTGNWRKRKNFKDKAIKVLLSFSFILRQYGKRWNVVWNVNNYKWFQ
jgi:hypothetical protein